MINRTQYPINIAFSSQNKASRRKTNEPLIQKTEFQGSNKISFGSFLDKFLPKTKEIIPSKGGGIEDVGKSFSDIVSDIGNTELSIAELNQLSTELKSDKSAIKKNIHVVIDGSGSMVNDAKYKGLTRMQATGEVLKQVSKKLLPNVNMHIYVFNSSVGLRKIGESKPNKIDKFFKEIGKFKPEGMTPLYDSVRECINNLPQTNDNKIIVITDGEDTYSKKTSIPLIKKTDEYGVVDVIGFKLKDDDCSDKQKIKNLAEKNNGTYQDANDIEELIERVKSSCKDLMVV